MTKARNLSDLLDATGDVVSSALDNVPPSDNASSLTTGTLPVARLADGSITSAKLDNSAKVVKGTSAPTSPEAGDLWYDTNTGVNLLKVYNTSSSSWVATNASTPTVTSTSAIESGIASNITLTGTKFGTGTGTITLTPSGGSASTISATPSNDTEVTGALPSAIYNLSSGTTVAVTYQNNSGLISDSLNITVVTATTGGTKVISG